MGACDAVAGGVALCCRLAEWVDGGVGRGTMSECDAMAWGCCSSQSKRRERGEWQEQQAMNE